jgi:hypothetical protein
MSPCKLLRYTMLGLVALLALVAAESTPRPRADAALVVDDGKGDVKADVKPEEFTLSVLAILATDQNKTIDERVSCIARRVQEKGAKFTGFQIHKMECRKIARDGTETFELIGGQTVCVRVRNGASEDERVQIVIEPPGMGEITYETCCGKFMPFITPYRTPDNQQLIVAVRVQPCKCSK